MAYGDDDIKDEEKERLLKSLDDSEEWERSDGLSTDHIILAVNSFEIVDEVDGTKPENNQLLLVNVTVENLLGGNNYDNRIVESTAEGFKDGTVQNEREKLAQELEEKEDGISPGNVVFDEHYMVFIDEQSEDE